MYIKRYSIASLVLMAMIGGYVFAYVTKESIAISLFGIPLPSLPIALWVIVPIVILYIASVLHFSFYYMLGSFKLRKYEKDYEQILDSIVEAYLGKKVREHSYKTPRYQLLGSLVDNTNFFPRNDLLKDIDNEKIKDVIIMISNIRDGEVVDLKKFKLLPDNELVIQNEKNRYKKGDISAEDILSKEEKYDSRLLKEVYADFVKTTTLKNIEKYKRFMTKDAIFAIVDRFNSSENKLDISDAELINLLKDIDMLTQDYIKISSLLSTSITPENRMKIFETLSEDSESAMEAYLYTLFDLEMLSPADEILENSQDDEYQNFKAYRALKGCNKHFNIELFL